MKFNLFHCNELGEEAWQHTVMVPHVPVYFFQNFSAKQTELRSQAVKVLSLNGLNHLDTLINENLADLVELLKAQQGMAFDPKDIIKKFLINVILAMVRHLRSCARLGDQCLPIQFSYIRCR